MLREVISRYGRTPGGYIWALLQPLAIILILSFAFALLQRTPKLGTSFILFKATGFLIVQMTMQTAAFAGTAMIFSRPLLAYPRVSWIDAVMARVMLNVFIKLVVTTLILTGIIYFEEVRTLLDWPSILLALTLAALMGFGLGILNCFLFLRFPVWQQVWGILTAPVTLFSGVIILYEEMPQLAQQILWYNPLLHVTAIMRMGFYPIYSPQYMSLVYICLWIVIPMVLGLILMRRYHRELLQL
ncbi:MAG: ABC transporter permease [Roseinatronobacter sp.]